ncbi:MAG: hypothetical protein C0505_03635 [Leptothrix sp. (in: Bacteria)]|nr:hypothetical protein [Leptothrix sp. (in: b-proteobacteria)]
MLKFLQARSANSMRRALRRLLWHLRERGLRATLAVGLKNIWVLSRKAIDQRFDRQFGVNTSGRVELTELTIECGRRQSGVYYEPTPRRTFFQILRSLHIEYSRFDFVDFGCGKGRTLLMASRLPFRTIHGVEFARELADEARGNVQRFVDPRRACFDIAVSCADAANFAIPDRPVLLYLFNPFGPDVMKAIVGNIEDALERGTPEVLVVYYHPLSLDIFEASPYLECVARRRLVFDLASPQLRGYAVFRGQRARAGRRPCA